MCPKLMQFLTGATEITGAEFNRSNRVNRCGAVVYLHSQFELASFRKVKSIIGAGIFLGQVVV